MAFLDWRSSFSVSNPEMDAHHQRLFRLLNDLHEAILTQRGRVDMGPIIDRLFEHTLNHFAAEEQLMESCGYPDLEAHRQEHERLLERVREMDATYRHPKSGKWEVVPEAFAFLLKDWLMEHILVMDKAYAPFVAGDEDPAKQG